MKVYSSKAVADRFWAKVLKTDTCWLWTACKQTKTGYGRFRLNKKTDYAHRVAWELVNGPIPEGLEPDHVCRVRLCVRPEPEHLELVTHRVNVLRGEGWAGKKSRQTSCVNGHPFDAANTYIRPSGRRNCRKCRNAAVLLSPSRAGRRQFVSRSPEPQRPL